MPKKQTKSVLQDLYDEQVAINEALEKRLQELELRLSGNIIPPVRIAQNPANNLMVETAKIIQDSSTVEKNSPFLKHVNEDSLPAFSLLYTLYRNKGGIKPTRNLMSPEVLNYYSFQISCDLLTMDDKILFDGINSLNQPSLDPMDVLISGLSMKFNKVYDKNLVQQYILSFTTLLENYPVINAKCKQEAIVKQFYNKLQPTSLSQKMLNLEIKDVKEAIQTLHSKLQKTMDILHFENSRGVKKSTVTESNENSRFTVEKCVNCKFSTKPENAQLHRIMKCYDIHFCYRCDSNHLAMGPQCKFKDKKIFDFEAYLEKKKVKEPTQNPRKETKVANIATEEFIKKSDFDELKTMFIDQMKKIDRKLDKTSNSDVSKKISGSALIIDSGCNHTCINDSAQSVSAIKMNRRSIKDTISVGDGRTAAIEGSGGY